MLCQLYTGIETTADLQEGHMGESPVQSRGRHRLSRRARYYTAAAAAVVLGSGAAAGAALTGGSAQASGLNAIPATARAPPSTWVLSSHTATPIKHVVVIFDENESFDHYFGTYPYAANTDGSHFQAKMG